ncbi:MAG: NAD(P) transhydrogenase subunit alpha [Saccharofermentanales bacterium]|jgi:NAD(P) transhydrogenase subunit alpha
MIIGVPKEIMPGERRVAASPETTKKMVQDGLTVLIEQGAGEGSFYHDEAYMAAGAEIVPNVADLYDRADIILKVKEPLMNDAQGKHEVELMKEGQLLITFIHPASPVNHAMVKQMANRGINSITLDSIPRITRAQNMDALTSMSTCAGYKGLLMAANELPKFVPQIFSPVGMIRPINALIIGVGVAGLQALATAKRLGAIVYAGDIRPAAVEQAQSLGAKTIDLGVPSEEAIGEGGYALALSEERLAEERKVLSKHLPNMDIVFLSALVPGKVAPELITEDMVKLMQPGSVIVDISIDQGGNCVITPPGTVESKHGVTLIGIKNIPGLIPTSSTWMFSQNVYNLLSYLLRDGKLVIDLSDDIIDSALTTYQGRVVHRGTLEAFALDRA